MSPWIDYVKLYSQTHGVSYKDALSLASPSYRSQTGGSMMGKIKGAKKAVKKGSKMVSQGSQLVDQFGTPLVTMVNPDAGAKLKSINGKVKATNGTVTQVVGGRFHLGKALKKVKTGSKIASNVMRAAAVPAGFVLGPEMTVGMLSAAEGIDQANKISGGGRYKRKSAAQNKYLQGGSFSRPGQSGGCLNTSQSSMLSHLHPSFTPIIPRSRY